MRNTLLVAAVCMPLCAAQAQLQGVDAHTLIQQGYEIKAAYNIGSYSDHSVIYLQSGKSAYVCAIRGQAGGFLSGLDVGRSLCIPI